MAGRLQKTSSARRDLLEHFTFIGRSNSAAATRFLRAAGKTMTMLAGMPEIAGAWESDNPQLTSIRVWPVQQFENYLIFYRVRTDGITVVRVLHAAQDIDTALLSSPL